ncbi:hypothetical protein FKM82_006758 [Ascaphus truei]
MYLFCISFILNKISHFEISHCMFFFTEEIILLPLFLVPRCCCTSAVSLWTCHLTATQFISLNLPPFRRLISDVKLGKKIPRQCRSKNKNMNTTFLWRYRSVNYNGCDYIQWDAIWRMRRLFSTGE